MPRIKVALLVAGLVASIVVVSASALVVTYGYGDAHPYSVEWDGYIPHRQA